MGIELDRARIAEVVTAVADELTGDFLLVGGALVALWLDPRRMSEDIDIIGFEGESRERFALMELAQRHGLPIEAVNSAADFFVFRIADWREQVEVLQAGARGRVFRPTPTLFLLLKVGRLSETDLDDCVSLLRHAQEGVDVARVLDALREGDDDGRSRRIEALREALSRRK